MEKFKKILGSDNPLLELVKKKGFEEPSEIQEKSIPEVLKGRDVVAQASTGSGKTFAFATALVKNVKKDHGIQGLILTPTRELAEQIVKELDYFSQDKKLNVISIYGGVSITTQMRRLPSTEIVVATPGRVLDHLNRNSIDLSHVNTLVLDEADRMFDMGFIKDVEKIISYCPKKRQTLLFSATMPREIFSLSEKHMNDPLEITATPHVDPTKLEQVYYDVDRAMKYSLLRHLLEKEDSKLVMIFCNTRRNVDFLSKNLQLAGIEAVPIHGGFTQDKRTKMLADFNSQKVQVLVATDVAARGLDIGGVSHVYNYDIPPTENEYTHRIGRTARAGKDGKVINIVVDKDYENFHNIKRGDYNIKVEPTPYVERIQIKWMEDSRSRDRIQSKFGRSSGNRGFSRGPSRFGRSSGSRGFNRSGSGRDSRSFGRDSRPRSRDGPRSDFGSFGRDSRPSRDSGNREDPHRQRRPSPSRDSGPRSRDGPRRDNRPRSNSWNRDRPSRDSRPRSRDGPRRDSRPRSSGKNFSKR